MRNMTGVNGQLSKHNDVQKARFITDVLQETPVTFKGSQSSLLLPEIQ